MTAATTTLGLEPEATFIEPVVGWRVWRVLRFEQLDGTSCYRMCAVGTLGNPKVWEPGRETVAACSKYGGAHESPWPACQCGVWALKDPVRARRRMIAWMRTQGGEKAGWALGTVSLWGRVVEHEDGWRGQYAYPLSLVVESEAAEVAEEIGSVYGVEVDWAGTELARRVRQRVEARRQQEEQERREKEELRAALTGTLESVREAQAGIESLIAEREASQYVVREVQRPVRDIDLSDATENEILVAAALKMEWDRIHRERRHSDRNTASLHDILSALAWRREVDAWRTFATIGPQLSSLEAKGLVEHGKLLGWSSTYWALTAAGRKKLRALPMPRWLTGSEYRDAKSETIRIKKGEILAGLELSRPLFEHELEAIKPTLIAEKMTARSRGRAAHRRWIDRKRREGRPTGQVLIVFTPEEVLSAVRTLTRRRPDGRPVPFPILMREIAPGSYTTQEAAKVSYRLARLKEEGLVVKLGVGLWRAAART